MVPNKNRCLDIQYCKTVIPRAAVKSQPSSCLSRKVLGDKAAVNWVASNTITTPEGSRGVPSWVRVSVGDCFVHVKAGPSKHIMKAARRHILVGVQENNETFPRLSPCKELLLEFPQKDDAWAVCNALLAEMAAVCR